MTICAVLMVLLCAPAQAQGPIPTGDQYASEPCPAPDPGACADAAVGDAASAAANSASEGSGSVNRALSAEGPVAGEDPEAGVPAEGASPVGPGDAVAAADPSPAAGGGEGPAGLPETGGPPALVLCAGTMLAGAGLMLARSADR